MSSIDDLVQKCAARYDKWVLYGCVISFEIIILIWINANEVDYDQKTEYNEHRLGGDMIVGSTTIEMVETDR